MNNKKITYICIILSIIGIFALYFLTISSYSEPISIENAKERLGEAVKIQGQVTKKSVSNGHAFFTISDESDDILGVIFKNSGINNDIFVKGDRIEVIGKISEYKGQMVDRKDKKSPIPAGSRILKVERKKKGFFQYDDTKTFVVTIQDPSGNVAEKVINPEKNPELLKAIVKHNEVQFSEEEGATNPIKEQKITPEQEQTAKDLIEKYRSGR